MHKIFLSVASIIVTHFLQKSYSNITEKPTIDKDKIYRKIKKAEYDARLMRNYQRAALSIIEQANLNLMESLEK